MPKQQSSLFSTKGFYLGVAIFTFGLCLMVARVVIDVNQKITENKPQEKTLSNDISNNLDNNLKLLQKKLDEKITHTDLTIEKDFSIAIDENEIKVFEHNPTHNKNGNITAIEYIDFGCESCLLDAQFVNNIIANDDNIKIISKLNNTSELKELHLENLAALIAAKQNKFNMFKQKVINKDTKLTLNDILDILSQSGVSLRAFRKELTNNSDFLLNNLAKDISQAGNLKINSYTIFINNRKFSDNPESFYSLKDIPLYLKNIQ